MDIDSLKVDPKVLIAKADEMNNEHSQISTLMTNAKSEISGLKNIWHSEASDEYQSRFTRVHDDIENVLKLVKSHIDGLKEAANIFTAAETSAKAQTEGLPTDGVFL